MNTLTFNASDWSGDVVTAMVTDLGDGESRVIYKGEQFEASQYESKYEGETLYEACDLTCEGRLIASAVKCGREWVAADSGSDIGGELTREDDNPIVALLQVASNIM